MDSPEETSYDIMLMDYLDHVEEGTEIFAEIVDGIIVSYVNADECEQITDNLADKTDNVAET